MVSLWIPAYEHQGRCSREWRGDNTTSRLEGGKGWYRSGHLWKEPGRGLNQLEWRAGWEDPCHSFRNQPDLGENENIC